MAHRWFLVLFIACLALASDVDPNEEDEEEPIIVKVKQGVMRGSAGM